MPIARSKGTPDPANVLNGGYPSFRVEVARSADPQTHLLFMLRKLARRALQITKEDGCLIHLLNPGKTLLEVALRYKVGKGFAHPMKPGEGIPGLAFRQRKVVIKPELSKGSSNSWTKSARIAGIVSAISLPLQGTKGPLGTLTFLSRKTHPFGPKEVPLFRFLADQAVITIENAHSYEKIRKRLQDLTGERRRERQIKRFLENIIDRSIDPIIATDLEGRLTFVSRGAEEMFGRSKQELIGTHIRDYYSGGEPETKKIMNTLGRKEKLRNYETEFIGPEGKKISVILSASLLKDSQGRPTGTLAVSREITEYKNLLNHITRTEQTYQKLFEAVNDAIFYLNSEGYFSTFNRMFLKITGYTEREIRSLHFSKIIHPDDVPMMMNDHQKVLRGEYAPERYTFRLINKEERVIYVEGNFRRVREKNDVVGVLAVLRDVTEKIRIEKELLELSITDGLTGLHNQRHFYNELDKEMERSKRQHTTLSLLLFDLDDFKVFNDIHGHLEGDKVLKNVAQAVLKSIRRMDSAYRYGGDEFTVILPGATQDEGAQVAERIKKSFESTPYLQQIKLSIGLVEFDPQYELTTFVKHADEAMYTAKKMGGDQIFILPKEKT